MWDRNLTLASDGIFLFTIWVILIIDYFDHKILWFSVVEMIQGIVIVKALVWSYLKSWLIFLVLHSTTYI